MGDIYVFIEHFQGKVRDISYICLAQAQSLARLVSSKVVGVALGSGIEPILKDLQADEILLIDDPSLENFVYDDHVATLAALIEEKQPGLLLFGDTSIGSDIAGGLAGRLNLPLLSFCAEIKVEEGKPRFVAKICGGKILTEGALPEGTSLVTMLPGRYKVREGQSATPPKATIYPFQGQSSSRIKFIETVLPAEEDLDISQANVLVSVGRGIENQDNLALVQELADALGGELSASRPVIDRGWLPSSRLVGKSGKSVKPKLYLAMGISGAPEHVESISESGMIIAVNTDPNAPIFNVARYGTTENLLDLTEELLLSIKELKGT